MAVNISILNVVLVGKNEKSDNGPKVFVPLNPESLLAGCDPLVVERLLGQFSVLCGPPPSFPNPYIP